MLANNGLHYLVFAVPKLCRKKKPGEKKLKLLKRIIKCPMLNGTTLVCVSRMWIVELPPDAVTDGNSSTLVPNMRAAVYSYGMTMSLTHAPNFCGKILKVKEMKTVPAEQKEQECRFYWTALKNCSCGETVHLTQSIASNFLVVINTLSGPFSRFARLFTCNLMRVRALTDLDGVDTQRTPGGRMRAHGIREKPAMNNINRFSYIIETKTKSGKMPKHSSGMD